MIYIELSKKEIANIIKGGVLVAGFKKGKQKIEINISMKEGK